MRFGDEDRPSARPDHRLDRVDVDVVRVGLDVDEHRHESGPHDRRDVGRERHRRRDDLVAGLQAEQLDREVQRGRSRVAHHAAALPEQLGDALLERAHVLADAQRLRSAAQYGDDRVDLAFVVHAAGVVDPAPIVGVVAPLCHRSEPKSICMASSNGWTIDGRNAHVVRPLESDRARHRRGAECRRRDREAARRPRRECRGQRHRRVPCPSGGRRDRGERRRRGGGAVRRDRLRGRVRGGARDSAPSTSW